MAETQFAKSFLALLDKKAIKLNSDYVSDPKRYPSQSPYILPKPSIPFPKRSHNPADSKSSTVDVTLKLIKSPSDSITLAAQDGNTSILDLKEQYAAQTGVDLGKIKLLYNKRPASDLKALKELLPTPMPSTVELGVMLLGGAGSASADLPAAKVASPAIQVPDPMSMTASAQAMDGNVSAGSDKDAQMEDVRPSTSQGKAHDVLKSDAFWTDLQGFLTQRLKDEDEGRRLAKVFRDAAAT